MALKLPDSRDFGFYAQMSQIALEMVVPIVGGVFADRWLGTTPWLLLLGAVVGLVGSLVHLLVLVNQRNRDRPSPPTRDAP